MFLKQVLEHLGAIYQEKFAKACTKDVKISTHLICKDPTGKKYQAALSWKVPVVTEKWLLECCNSDTKADEKLFGLNSNNSNLQENKVVTPKPPQLITRNEIPAFPSTSKHSLSKLDISISKTDIQMLKTATPDRISPNPTSPFVGFQNKSIEKSCRVSEDVNKETSLISDNRDEGNCSFASMKNMRSKENFNSMADVMDGDSELGAEKSMDLGDIVGISNMPVALGMF